MNYVSSRSHALLTQVMKQKVRVINLYFSVPPFFFSILLSFVSFRGKSNSCKKCCENVGDMAFVVQEINGVVLAAISIFKMSNFYKANGNLLFLIIFFPFSI